MTVRRTNGLLGVTNGSPWFGRVNGVALLTQGSQRYASTMPLTFVNSHEDPLSEVRRWATYLTRTTVVAPTGSTPPSGTTMVWSLTLPLTSTPSTLTERRSIPPSRATAVLSSTRSIGPPDVFVIVAALWTANARVP